MASRFRLDVEDASMRLCAGILLLSLLPGCAPGNESDALTRNEWIDKHTGHRVIRLSRREGANEGFYFHQNPFTAEGDKMVFLGSTDTGRCAFTVDLRTQAIQQITDRSVGFEVVAPKRRELFYLSGDTVYATHLDTLATREIARLPAHYVHGRGFSVNADESLLVGCYALGEEKLYSTMPREKWIAAIFEAKLPNALYTISIDSGEVREFYHENAWLGHTQFSPTDSSLLEFCHEGPERRLNRMWIVRTDGAAIHNVYEKIWANEFITHEFWDPDGQRVWYDGRIPSWVTRKLPFLSAIIESPVYLGCTDVTSGRTKRYRLKSRQYSWHYNISADGKMICGDGDGRFFRLCPSGKWIYLFRPDGAKMRVERLCSMRNHSYKIAPNTHFTPDEKWVVFTSDMSGTSQVYGVEVTPIRAGGRPRRAGP
jgi:oligogalacturonide lyase